MRLRDWLAESSGDPVRRAENHLRNGQQRAAAEIFSEIGKHREAAQAYRKAAVDSGDDTYTYECAIREHELAGEYDSVRSIYELLWLKDSKHLDVTRLANHRQLERFVRNVGKHRPEWLAHRLREAKAFKLAGDMFKERVRQNPADDPNLWHRESIECYIKAGIPGFELGVSVAEWKTLLEDSCGNTEAFGLLRQANQIDKFVDDVVLEDCNSNALDPFSEYLREAIGSSPKHEWRPVLDAYYRLLLRIRDEHNVDLNLWHYWSDLIGLYHRAGDADLAMRLKRLQTDLE